MFLTLDNLTISAKNVPAGIDGELTPYSAAACKVRAEQVLRYRIIRRSLDARKKPDVKLLYRLEAELTKDARPAGALSEKSTIPDVAFEVENPHGLAQPVVVGAGPGGLFAAYVLALAGAKPVVLERGFDVVKRKKDIENFFALRRLDTESNFLYGEGGAGTWSDGKLFTRVKDPRMGFVMQTFVDCGAPEQILYFSHPHLGSDRLPGIVSALREKIIALGGEFRWGCNVEDIVVKNGRCSGVKLHNGEILEAPRVLIASGHSARDLICRIAAHGGAFRMKGFQVGMRIEHPQRFINRMQYGKDKSYPALGAAEYALALSPSDGMPGAASFCMCPGGEIIPATCENGTLCTNGMSNFARSGEFANSALITTIDGGKFNSPAAAFDFLHGLERAAFLAGGMDYTAPAQTAKCFLDGGSSKGKLPAETSYRLGRVPYQMERLLPEDVTQTLRRALVRFEKIMPGFVEQGVFTGIESRVSSPVRFERDPEKLDTVNISGLYLAGEGAGMAGGITSAAVDGVRLAEAMLRFH